MDIVLSILGRSSSHASFSNHSLLDENGNCSLSGNQMDGGLRKSLSSHRFPHSVVLVVGGWCGESPIDTVEIYEPRSRRWNVTSGVFPNLLKVCQSIVAYFLLRNKL